MSTSSPPTALATSGYSLTVDTPDGAFVCHEQPTPISLRVTITNTTDHPLALQAVTVSVRVGTGPEDLTTTTTTVTPEPAPGWTVTRPAPEQFHATPALPQVILAPYQDWHLTLSGLTPNPHTGPSTVTITVRTEQSTPDIHHRVITKHPPAVVLTNFAPDTPEVPYKGTVTFSWHCPTPQGELPPNFDLTYGTQTLPIQATDKNFTHHDDVYTYRFPYPLLSNTAFLLTARHGSDSTSLVTWVTVTKGDIDAGDLTVNGHVRILRPTPAPQDSHDLNTKNAKATFTYPNTDGFLAAWVRTGQPDQPATLTITPSPGDLSDDDTAVVLTSTDTTYVDNILVPLPAGQCTVKLAGPDQSTAHATLFRLGITTP
jgi:hypothetical protein